MLGPRSDGALAHHLLPADLRRKQTRLSEILFLGSFEKHCSRAKNREFFLLEELLLILLFYFLLLFSYKIKTRPQITKIMIQGRVSFFSRNRGTTSVPLSGLLRAIT